MIGSYLPMDQSVSNNDRTVCQAILLVVNKSSGSGRSKSELKTIANSFKSRFETIPIRKFVIAQSHQEVTQITQGFLRRTPGPWLVISGGGSGTQRAMIQGIMTAVQKGHAALNKITHSALRLGSGNIIARHSGISPHPALALHQIDAQLAARSFIYSPIYRCQIRYSNRVVSEFGLTMAGIGHFGEVPDAVSAWRMNNQTLMNGLLHFFPLEKINTWLFFWFTLQRAFSCLKRPFQLSRVQIRQGSETWLVSLFAGLLINFDFAGLPFSTGFRLNESRFCLALFLANGRFDLLKHLFRIRNLDECMTKFEITSERPLALTFINTSWTLISLDEDTFMTSNQIEFSVAGRIRMIPGDKGEAG